MYQIKPVLERKLIEEMPDCMYNLKPINKGVAMDSKNSQENNVSYFFLNTRNFAIFRFFPNFRINMLTWKRDNGEFWISWKF